MYYVIAVQREDLDLAIDPRAQALAIADNRVGELNLEWDLEMLKQLHADGLDLSAFWTDAEFDELFGGGRNGHEPRSRINSRQMRALELSNQGFSQVEIAAELGITQAAVSKILRRVETRILRDRLPFVERQWARQIHRLEHIYNEVRCARGAAASATEHAVDNAEYRTAKRDR